MCVILQLVSAQLKTRLPPVLSASYPSSDFCSPSTAISLSRPLRWLPPVLHFPEPLNFTKGSLAHYDGLVPVLARWCYNSF